TTIPCMTPSGALGFTTVPGSSTCGGPGLASPAPAAPFSGEVDSDTAGTAKIVDLGLGCLYLGGGQATVIPPLRLPAGAPNSSPLPPWPIASPPPFGALTTCVLNVIASDASGALDTATGASTLAIPLSSRVYSTGNTASPCPACVNGSCTYGPRVGAACTTT